MFVAFLNSGCGKVLFSGDLAGVFLSSFSSSNLFPPSFLWSIILNRYLSRHDGVPPIYWQKKSSWGLVGLNSCADATRIRDRSQKLVATSTTVFTILTSPRRPDGLLYSSPIILTGMTIAWHLFCYYGANAASSWATNLYIFPPRSYTAKRSMVPISFLYTVHS